MSKTNDGLVKYAKAMIGHPYWYGCYGQVSSKELYRSKKRQYPNQYEWACPDSQLGTRVFDCVGLIKAYLWCKDTKSNPVYNSKQDVSANGMLEKCKKKGKIKTIPEVPGVLVFRLGHVGVYIGDGYVIEAKGHRWGVVKSRLKDRGFTDWGYCPWIEYNTTTAPKKEEKKEAPKPATKEPVRITNKYFPKYTGKSVSIADALNSLHFDSSYSYRKQIAKKNGIKAYIGTSSQNTKMLNLLKQGKLLRP